MAITGVTVSRGGDGAPGVAEVESLYFAAFHEAPLRESRDVARSFAQLYGWLISRPDLITVFTRARLSGELTGLAYGHPWNWAEQSDEWASQLRNRLGNAAGILEGRLAVYLLAVDPGHRRQGLGRTLLSNLLKAAGTEHAWLITRDERTPAMTLYVSEGWASLGHGPDAPNERPGLVMIKG